VTRVAERLLCKQETLVPQKKKKKRKEKKRKNYERVHTSFTEHPNMKKVLLT
jgi:hypothetical protein